MLDGGTVGRWLWKDHAGEYVADLPECKPAPTCGTIQEQADAQIPFSEDYVSTGYESYVKVTGPDFVNDSVPVKVSKVNLTCFYEGKYLTSYYKFILT